MFNSGPFTRRAWTVFPRAYREASFLCLLLLVALAPNLTPWKRSIGCRINDFCMGPLRHRTESLLLRLFHIVLGLSPLCQFDTGRLLVGLWCRRAGLACHQP